MRRQIVLLLCTALGSVGALGVVTAAPAAAVGVTRFVAPGGSDTANSCVSALAPCATVGRALDRALEGDTVQLEPGTYMARDNPPGQPSVIASSGVTVQSDPVGGTAANTIIDATDVGVGLTIWFDGATIKNLTIRNAYRNGIVARDVAGLRTTAVTVSGNIVTGNNKCKNHPTVIGCTAPAPGTEYGAGIAFHGIDTSSIANNTVTDNFAGILVNDGPDVSLASASISVEHNTVNDNRDSGIVFRSTDPLAVTTGSGISDGSIRENTANGNGGAGILVTESSFGARVQIDSIALNEASDNGLPGITIHTPSGGSPNIQGNTLRNDALHGGAGGGPGDSLAGVRHTTGILMFSSPSAITNAVITGNTISDVFYGIWIPYQSKKGNVSGNSITVDPGGASIFVDTFIDASHIGIARTPSGHGYWQVRSDGAVAPFGDAGYFGSLEGSGINAPVVGIAATSSGHGYWLVASDGGVFSFGDARFFGSTGAMHLNRPVVGMAAGPSGNGYWLVASDGGIFSYGSAKFHGSTGAIHLNRPVVGMATGPAGNGYWLVASDGGIFSYGSAKFHGSTGAIHLNRPVVGMAGTPTELGYWLGASDGGIFAFPDAHYYGSAAANQAHE